MNEANERDMTTITPADWTAIVRTAWENPDGKGCGRLYQLAKLARDQARRDCVDIVALKLWLEAACGEGRVKDGVYHHTGTAPAVTLLLLIRVGVVTDREKWLERIRREWSAELNAHPRVQREANNAGVTL